MNAIPSAPASEHPGVAVLWRTYGTPMVVLALAAAVATTITRNWNGWEGGHRDQATDDATVRGDLTPLSTKVPGIVRAVRVSDYQAVHRGDTLVELRDDDYLAQVAQATAGVEAGAAAIENNHRQQRLQEARIAQAQEGIGSAQEQITAAQAARDGAHADVVRTASERRRQERLITTQSTTTQQLETAVADAERFAAQAAAREAAYEQAQTALRTAHLVLEEEHRSAAVLESQELQLAADLHAKQAALTVAQVNVGYTRILAPGDGTVGERLVRPGQLVSPGTQVMTFVDRGRWVQGNYRETQLTNVKVGDSAEMHVDEYPGRVFHGTVVEISPATGSQVALLPPDNATGNYTKIVQRIPVKVALDDSSSTMLRPGLSATVTIRTRQ
jgi:membrane fusion protein (multidrug efflux system)